MLTDLLQYSFLQRALLAGVLASIACGVIGSFVVVKRMSSISGGLSHAAFGGIGLGYLLGFNPMLGAAAFCLVLAFIMGIVYRRQHSELDTLISMTWAVGMSLGILFISLTPGFAPDLTSYLFGSILFVPENYLFLIAVLDIIILIVVSLLFKELQAVCFDEEFTEVRGVLVEPIFLVLMALIALSVVTLIRIVGVVMMIALLTTPAVIARQWCGSLRQVMCLATFVSTTACISGVVASFWLSQSASVNLPTGPLIILLVTAFFIISSSLRVSRRR